MNILVIRLGLLGDLVCTTPILEAIKKHFPNGRLCLLSNEYSKPVVSQNPYIDKLYTYVHTRQRQRNPRPSFIASMLDAWRLKRDLKLENFDWIIICNAGFNKPSVRIAQKLGGKIVSATRENGSYEYKVHYPIRGLLTERKEHEIVRTFRLLEPLGINLSELPEQLTLKPNEATLNKVRTLVHHETHGLRIALHISSRDAHREWPIDLFANVINWLCRKSADFHPVVIYSKEDHHRLSRLKGLLTSEGRVNFVQPTSIESLIAIVSLCGIVVCQEGGILHIAAGLSKPVVGLYENTPEKLNGWYPWGVPYRQAYGLPGQLIRDIPSEKVINELSGLIAETQGQRSL